MLVFDLDPICKLRGIKQNYTFLKKLGLTHMMAERLSVGATRTIKADHVEAICLALKCTPDALFAWKPDADTPVVDQPLMALVRKEEPVDVLAELRNLPMDKVEEVMTYLREMK